MYRITCMKIAISGSSGLIGGALVPALEADGHETIRLVRREATTAAEASWDPTSGIVDLAALGGVDAIVHLAGENIGQRWTSSTKRAVRESRVDGTRAIAQAVAVLDPTPVLVSASAIGFYGSRGDELLTEASSRGTGFLADVVEAWEDAARPAHDAGARVVHLRQGIVLSRHGGALQKLLTPFKLGVGGRVGSGKQWWSWIGLADAVAAYRFALGTELEGPVNVTAPNPVTNTEFVKALGRALGRPSILPLPSFAVSLAFGQMGREMLLDGQRVLPERLEQAGFDFAQPTLDAAMAAALGD
jgi:uncharacterized protein (TIGR01777 family)